MCILLKASCESGDHPDSEVSEGTQLVMDVRMYIGKFCVTIKISG